MSTSPPGRPGQEQRPVLPTGAFARAGRLALLPLRHAGRTAAAASRLSRAAGDQVAVRTAEQVFATLGELKGGAVKLGQAMSVFEAAMPEEVAAPARRRPSDVSRGSARGSSRPPTARNRARTRPMRVDQPPPGQWPPQPPPERPYRRPWRPRATAHAGERAR